MGDILKKNYKLQNTNYKQITNYNVRNYKQKNNQKLLRGRPDASRGGFYKKSPPGRRRQICKEAGIMSVQTNRDQEPVNSAVEGRHQWNIRPGIFTTRMIRTFLFLLGIELGFMVFLVYYKGSPRAITAMALFGLPIFLFSLLLCFKAAGFLISFLRKQGVFGRIKCKGIRLEIGNSASVIDLDQPFDLEVRRQNVTIQRDFYNYYMNKLTGRYSVTRAKPLSVFAAAAVIRQDEKWYTLYCDDAGENKHGYSVEGLGIKHEAFFIPKGKVFRLEPADFMEFLRVIKNSKGKQHLQDIIPETKVRPAWAEIDPRKVFCSNLKTALGAAIFVLLSAVPPYIIISQFNPGEIKDTRVQHSKDIIPQQETQEPSIPVDRPKPSQEIGPETAASPGQQEEQGDEIPFDVALHIRELKNENSLIRRISAAALGKIGSRASAAIPALTEALQDKDTAVRQAAAEALKQIRNQEKENSDEKKRLTGK